MKKWAFGGTLFILLALSFLTAVLFQTDTVVYEKECLYEGAAYTTTVTYELLGGSVYKKTVEKQVNREENEEMDWDEVTDLLRVYASLEVPSYLKMEDSVYKTKTELPLTGPANSDTYAIQYTEVYATFSGIRSPIISFFERLTLLFGRDSGVDYEEEIALLSKEGFARTDS